jgi:hypothetical protein
MQPENLVSNSDTRYSHLYTVMQFIIENNWHQLMILQRWNTGIVGLNPTEAWLCVSFLLCCDVLCRQRFCDGQIPYLRSHTQMPKTIVSEVNSISEGVEVPNS